MATDLQSLNATFGKPGAVSFVDHPLGGPAAQLVTSSASAAVALHGAHVLSFIPRGGKDALWMSPEAIIAPGEGIRGGIPVCWPWFAAHAIDPGKPDHGFVRKTSWRVARTFADAGEAGIELAFEFTPEHRRLWDGEAELSLVVALSDQLRVDLVTRNLGPAPVAITDALHTYFAIDDVAAIAVHGLESRPYLDKLQGFARLTQQGAITFAGEVDRIYQDTTDDIVIDDPGNARKIRIAKLGSTSTVVWNPWVEKSARLSHMPPDAYLGMVCVETTNAGGDVVTLNPRDSHRLSAILSVEPR